MLGSVAMTEEQIKAAAEAIDDLYARSAASDDAGDWPEPAEIAAILRQHSGNQDGWVMTKVKPTITMLEAGMAVPLAFDRHAAPTEVAEIYKAMLSAAPAAKDAG